MIVFDFLSYHFSVACVKNVAEVSPEFYSFLLLKRKSKFGIRDKHPHKNFFRTIRDQFKWFYMLLFIK